MLLSEPGRTDFDINFSIFGFPVRVHPFFFIMPLILGRGLLRHQDMSPGVVLLVITIVFFLSILIHELGHTLAFRYFGIDSRIVLYWMGGLAIPNSGMGPSWASRSKTLSPKEQIVVSLAGPAAGLLFGLALVGVIYLLGGSVTGVTIEGIFPYIHTDYEGTIIGDSPALEIFFFVGLWCNLFWNVLNLVPVYPLDGGQVARQLFTMFDPWKGVQYSIILSIVASVLLAVVGFMSGEMFLAFFFGFMAYSAYMSLQQSGFGGGGRPW